MFPMRCLAALLSSTLLTLAMPGSGDFWPLLFTGLLPLLLALQGCSPRTGFWLGMLCGGCHYLGMLYWIVIVLSTYGGLPLWLAAIGLLCLAVYMGLYCGLFGWLGSRLLKTDCTIGALLGVPLLWVGLDWLRGVLLTGFPWMDLGYGLYRQQQLVQVADIGGHHGLSFLLVLSNVGLLFAFAPGRRRLSGRFAGIVVPLVIIGCSMVYGQYRLAALGRKIDLAERAEIGIVQGNIDQSRKWSPSLQQATVEKYLGLSVNLADREKYDLVIWPETALPFYPPSGTSMGRIREFARGEGVALISGAPWYEIVDREKKEIRYFNSGFLMTAEGIVVGRYDKSHLVPFGEYVPLKRFLFFLEPLVESVGDFSPGKVERPLALGEVKAGILICFESVFPELARKWVEAGANLLINLTNDAWYGKSSAPHQSLAMSVVRAVETRRSVVRSANTGFSAFVGPDGTIEKVSKLFEDWAGAQPVILLDEKTFWVQYGWLFGPVALLLGLLGLSLWTRRAPGNKSGYVLETGKIG